MRVIHKEIPIGIELSNAHEIIEEGKCLRTWLDAFIEETEKLKGSEITATIDIKGLNDVKIHYDFIRVTKKMADYQKIIKKLNQELDAFVKEVNNISFNNPPISNQD